MEIPSFIDKTAEILAAKVEERRKVTTQEDLKDIFKALDESDAILLVRAIREKKQDLFMGVFEVVISQVLQEKVK